MLGGRTAAGDLPRILYEEDNDQFEDSTMAQVKTCLDCGFLTIRRRELSQADRVMLGAKGRSSVMPANPEQTQCFKNLWTQYDLMYAAASFGGVVEEIGRDRKPCQGFTVYEAGFTPEQHLEHPIDRRKEKLQWRIAKLGFLGALLGGIVATALAILKWAFELATK